MATSGPSEPWRNADDFADYVAAKGRGGNTAGGGAAFGSSAAAAATRASGKGNNLPRATTAAKAAAAPPTPSTRSSYFSPGRVGGGGDRRRGSPGFDVGERKGGALYDDGQVINGEVGCTVFDSIGVDLGSM